MNQSKGLKTLIAILLIMTTFLYVFVTYTTTGGFSLDLTLLLSSSQLTYVVLAVLTYAFSFVVPSFLEKKMKSNKEIPDPTFVPFLIKYVLLEFIVILGLVSSFNLKKNVMLFFFVPAVVTMILSFPRDNKKYVDRSL